MRFLLAGMAIVAGVLLLLASVGGPGAFTDSRSAIAPDVRFKARDASAVAGLDTPEGDTPRGVLPGDLRGDLPGDLPQGSAGGSPEVDSRSATADAPAAGAADGRTGWPGAGRGAPAPVADADPAGPQHAAGRGRLARERADLQTEIDGLRLQLVETIQNLNDMEAKADQARHELEQLQQELALAKLQQSGGQMPAADPTTTPVDGVVPPKRAVPHPEAASAAVGPPRAPRAHSAVRAAAPSPPDASETVLVLDRLRHEPARPADPAAAGDAPPVVSSTAAARLSPRERLLNARRAIAAGRIAEAQRLLEEAQLQLVFRPMSPAGGTSDTPGGSRAAGRVADALTMLGNNDPARALQHIDQALVATGADGQPAGAANAGPANGGAASPVPASATGP